MTERQDSQRGEQNAAQAQRFIATAEITVPVVVQLGGDEDSFTDQIEQAVQDEICHTGAVVEIVTGWRYLEDD